MSMSEDRNTSSFGRNPTRIMSFDWGATIIAIELGLGCTPSSFSMLRDLSGTF